MSIHGQENATNSSESKGSAITLGQSVTDLDMEVSVRQALGSSYTRPKDLDRALATYRAGILALPPQPIWQGDFTDWTADPFGDRNWRFQHHTLRWMNPLRWAALDGDDDARAEWIRVAKSWANTNIPAQSSPADFAWKDMVDGNRAIQLSLGAPLVGENHTWFVELLQYHRDWLMDEEHIVGRNHGLHQHSGLLVVGATLRDARAVETAVTRMSKQFESTFDVQGANDEGSSSYHQMNIIWWSHAWKRAALEGLEAPPEAKHRLDTAMNVLAHLALPNGEIPQIGDAARGRVNKGLSDITDFVATRGAEGAPPSATSLVLNRGYVISRSGWGKNRAISYESHMLARHGKNLKAHSHQDRGSVHIYAAGQRWLVDSGFHSYQHAAPEVKYLKSREAHNVASILGRKHDDDAPVELVAENVNDAFHDFTMIDHGYDGVKLSRRVIYFVEADCWIVSDRAISEDQVQIAQRWHVEPGVSSRFLDNGFRLSSKSEVFGMYWLGRGTKLSRTIAGDKSLDGWIGTKWKTLEPGTLMTAKSSLGRPHLVTIFGAHGATPLSIIESWVATNGDILAHFARGASRWRVTITNEKVVIKKA